MLKLLDFLMFCKFKVKTIILGLLLLSSLGTHIYTIKYLFSEGIFVFMFNYCITRATNLKKQLIKIIIMKNKNNNYIKTNIKQEKKLQVESKG